MLCLYMPCIAVLFRQRSYHAEYTGSRLIAAVKPRWAALVLSWVTRWEYAVLLASLFVFATHRSHNQPPAQAFLRIITSFFVRGHRLFVLSHQDPIARTRDLAGGMHSLAKA